MGSWLIIPLPPPASHPVSPATSSTEPCCLFTPRPQACKNNICLDLSPGHGLDGRLTGHRVETWDVKVCAHVSSVCRKHERGHMCTGRAGEWHCALGGLEETQISRLEGLLGWSGAGDGWVLPSHGGPHPQDVVNCVGGMGALLPLLERVATQPQEAEAGPAETHDLVGPELTSGHNATQGLLLPLGRSSGKCPCCLNWGEEILAWLGDWTA